MQAATPLHDPDMRRRLDNLEKRLANLEYDAHPERDDEVMHNVNARLAKLEEQVQQKQDEIKHYLFQSEESMRIIKQSLGSNVKLNQSSSHNLEFVPHQSTIGTLNADQKKETISPRSNEKENQEELMEKVSNGEDSKSMKQSR